MSTTTATMAQQLAAVYPLLKAGVDYVLSADGTHFLKWAPRQTNLQEPMPQELAAAYATWQARNSQNSRLVAAKQALDAFWASLTPAQQAPLLGQKAALMPLNTDTPAKVLLVQQLAASASGLSDAQSTLKAAVLTAVGALAA